MSWPAASNRQFTIAVIFAMEVELNAFRFMLDEVYRDRPPRRSDDPNRYFFGRVGPHNVVLARLADMQGKGAAATVAANLSRSFPSIQWRLLVGVGGGVPGPRHDIQLGDVVVSMPTTGDAHGGVVQYDLGRGTEDGFRRKGFLKQPPSYLVSTVSEMKANHMEGSSEIETFIRKLLDKSPEIHDAYQQPDRSTDILFPNHVPHATGMKTCENCDKTSIIARPERDPFKPKIHYGLIASGDEVVVTLSRRQEFIDRVNGDVLCFEMEAAGIATEYPCLVIRGISDYADPHKTKGWQPYASATAAACAKELLYLIEHDDVHLASQSRSEEVSQDLDALHQAELKKQQLLAALDFRERDARKSNVQPEQSGTCEWFLRTKIWQKWYESFGQKRRVSAEDRLICIRGKPGAGKSTLMKFLLDHTHRDLRDMRSPAHIVISHFFNARGTELEKSVEGMYRTLLSHLLKHVNANQLDRLPSLRNIPAKHRRTVNEMSNILRDALREVAPRLVTCFVDALDECDQREVNTMLRVLKSILKAVPSLRVCFACRHYPSLPIDEDREGTIVLEKQPGHKEDLRTYIKSNMKIDYLQFAAEFHDEILQKCDGVFMYCVLVVDLISVDCRKGKVNTRKDIQKLLSTLPDELNDLFDEILTRAGLSEENRLETALCMQWVLFAHDKALSRSDLTPGLTPEFLWWAIHLGLSPSDSDHHQQPSKTSTERYILDVSRGLVEVTSGGQVQVIHETVREFLLYRQGLVRLAGQTSWDSNDVVAFSHKRLLEICWQTIFSQPATEAWFVKGTGLGSFQIYAIRGLFRHADVAQLYGIDQNYFLESFRDDEIRQQWIQCYIICYQGQAIPNDVSLQTLLFWHGTPRLLCLQYANEVEAGRNVPLGLTLSRSQAIDYYISRSAFSWSSIELRHIATDPAAVNFKTPMATALENAIRGRHFEAVWAVFDAHLRGQQTTSESHIGFPRQMALMSCRLTTGDLHQLRLDSREALTTASPVILLNECVGESCPIFPIFCLIMNLTRAHHDPDQKVSDWSGVPKTSLASTISWLLDHDICPYGIDTYLADKTDMLLWAIEKQHHDIARRLIQTYGIEGCRDRDGRTPLHAAAVYNQEQLIEQLLPLYTYEPGDLYGNSPMALAISCNSHAAFQKLSSWPLTQFDRRNYAGQTPLAVAVSTTRRSASENIFKELFSMGNIGATIADNEGYTILHHAARLALGSHEDGELSILEAVINSSWAASLINTETKEGKTPMDIAWAQNNGVALELLGSHGGICKFYHEKLDPFLGASGVLE